MKPKDNELQRRAGSTPVLGSGQSADRLPSPLHPTRPGDREPVSYFELQRRSLNSDPDIAPRTDAKLPPLPSSSPWAKDPVPDEPTIDRTEDGDVMGVDINQLP
jgi:hypothetical protein